MLKAEIKQKTARAAVTHNGRKRREAPPPGLIAIVTNPISVKAIGIESRISAQLPFCSIRVDERSMHSIKPPVLAEQLWPR